MRRLVFSILIILITCFSAMPGLVRASSVAFYAVDDLVNGTSDNLVTIYFDVTDLLNSGWELQYLHDNNWDSTGASITVNTDENTHLGSVYLRLYLAGSSSPDGTISFLGPGTNDFGIEDVYNSAKIVWANAYTVSFQVAGDNDDFKAVPIPAAAILFGSGLLGLVGFGLRRQRKALAA